MNKKIAYSMTTREIAEMLGVSVDTVSRASSKVLDPSAIQRRVINGGVSKVFTEEQATLIKQEIQRHHNLVNRRIDQVSTAIEENETIAKALDILQSRADRYKKLAEENLEKANAYYSEICNNRPKVEFAEKALGSEDLLLIRDVAKILAYPDLGEKKLFQLLRDKNVLSSTNRPYQHYIVMGYFKLCESVWTDREGKDHVCLTPKVTQRGVAYIQRLVNISKQCEV